MRVTEIFKSIQGESTYAGHPCVFVRTTGCNLRCVWCDTAYAFYGGTEMTIAEVMDKVHGFHCDLVEITGGEPLIQKETFPLMTALLNEGHQVLLETSGSIDISRVDRRAVIVMDIKCPHSGMTEAMRWENIAHVKHTDEVKFVIKDRHDYDWAKEIIARYRLAERCPLLFSPVFGEMEPRLLADWILQDALPVRLQLQLHKYIWDPAARGV